MNEQDPYRAAQRRRSTFISPHWLYSCSATPGGSVSEGRAVGAVGGASAVALLGRCLPVTWLIRGALEPTSGCRGPGLAVGGLGSLAAARVWLCSGVLGGHWCGCRALCVGARAAKARARGGAQPVWVSHPSAWETLNSSLLLLTERCFSLGSRPLSNKRQGSPVCRAGAIWPQSPFRNTACLQRWTYTLLTSSPSR